MNKKILETAVNEGFQVMVIVVKLEEQESRKDWSRHVQGAVEYLKECSEISKNSKNIKVNIRVGVVICLKGERPRLQLDSVWSRFLVKIMNDAWSYQGMQEKLSALDRSLQECAIDVTSFEILKPPRVEHVQDWQRLSEVKDHIPLMSREDIHKKIFQENPELHMDDLYLRLEKVLNRHTGEG